ncbi:alpha/beta fold hydrolase [Candidatus Pantoea multigeneris]|uniref:Alpha/beta fold hydrolase n=1 Tax=Candidatus Pantoea multigeneris TaxID=2608357 RepID=A0ABX0R9V3_9GAMM|nr:alpha/beta hydrolase [Pantoea multigeneris]NIF22141.1 alpha/beta fold hydrolase [Pantoea multigeneris]
MNRTSEVPQLSYCAAGKGPLVIMLHGLLMDGKSWQENGFISAFSPSFSVVCPDLIGHGESDKPAIQEWYTRDNQALTIVNLMDELGYEKAHIIGYSSGAWLATGLLALYPERVESVVLGGWDCTQGMPESLSFEIFMAYAHEVAPQLTHSMSPADEKSVEYFFNELKKQTKGDDKLLMQGIPALVWAGTRDPYYAPMAELAEKHAIPLISGQGDHLSEVNTPDGSTIGRILKFIKDRSVI